MKSEEKRGQDVSKKVGLSCRERLKRSDQSKWDVGRRSHDPVEFLIASNKGRIPELLPIKMGRMAASPFGFFRGAVPLMAADLATLPVTKIEVQICGDAHVRNMGCFAAPDGRLVFDINDFDETIRGPFEWDLKRMAASLVLAGRESGHKAPSSQQAVVQCIERYRATMRAFAKMPGVDVGRFQVHRLSGVEPVHAALLTAERATPHPALELQIGRA